MSRIDPDRDVVIVPEKETLPGAIAERVDKYTHAYPEDFRMNRGDVQIFGPKKAAPVQRARVLERSDARTPAAIALVADVEIEEVEAEVRRSWADEEADEETPQYVRIHRG